MQRMRAIYSIGELCEALGVSASGYYAARRRPCSRRQISNQQLLQSMKAIHAHRHTRCYGSPRMTRELQDRGLSCSENRVARLMRCHGLRARPRKPFRPRTTRPDHAAHPSPNRLAQAGSPSAPGTQLRSDITYLPTREGWLYLAVVIDGFSRSVLGWKLADSLHTELVSAALRRALDSGLVEKQAIFHSDRGCQYSARSFRQLLERHHLIQSMSAAGCCHDNALAESHFASLKNELLPDGQLFASKQTAATAVFDYLETFYNRTRRHSALGYLSPHAFLNQYFQSQNPTLH